MARDWRTVVDGMTRVQKLVHLAMRLGEDEVERWRVALLRQLRDEYVHELEMMAERVGCKRRAHLGEGPILAMLNEQASEWAKGIVNTYNYDLAQAIVAISKQTPTANRHVYAARLRAWEQAREKWKLPQIAAYTSGWARARAQEDFRRYNGVMGSAELVPKSAVCPVCQAIIARGRIPLRVALNDSPPYHPSCPHRWSIFADKITEQECALLWMGE